MVNEREKKEYSLAVKIHVNTHMVRLTGRRNEFENGKLINMCAEQFYPQLVIDKLCKLNCSLAASGERGSNFRSITNCT